METTEIILFLSVITSIIILIYLAYTDLKTFFVDIRIVNLFIITITPFLYIKYGLIVALLNISFVFISLILFILQYFGFVNQNWMIGNKFGLTDIYLIILFLFLLIFPIGDLKPILTSLLFFPSVLFVNKILKHVTGEEGIRNILSHFSDIKHIIKQTDEETLDSYFFNVYKYRNIFDNYRKGKYLHKEEDIKKIIKSVGIYSKYHPYFPIFSIPIIFLLIANSTGIIPNFFLHF